MIIISCAEQVVFPPFHEYICQQHWIMQKKVLHQFSLAAFTNPDLKTPILTVWTPSLSDDPMNWYITVLASFATQCTN